MDNKFLNVLKSRKFWASVISLGISVGIFTLSDDQAGEIVEAIMVLVPVLIGLGYNIATGIEDAGRAQGGQNVQ